MPIAWTDRILSIHSSTHRTLGLLPPLGYCNAAKNMGVQIFLPDLPFFTLSGTDPEVEQPGHMVIQTTSQSSRTISHSAACALTVGFEGQGGGHPGWPGGTSGALG